MDHRAAPTAPTGSGPADLDEAEANRLAAQIFGAGSEVEQRQGGFVLWRVPELGHTQGGPEGVALPAREIIGTGPTRRQAIESAQHALHPTAPPR